MSRFLSLCFVALAVPLLLAPSCGSTAPGEGAPRILLFTRTEGYRHGSIGPAVAALRRLGRAGGVVVDATEDARAFDAANLLRYDAVVFLLTTGDVLDEAQQDALEAYVRGGGGFAGIHSATDTEYGWPWYGELVGARFDGHPSDPGVRAGTLHPATHEHAATRGLPDPWLRADEWYQFREVQPGLTVLLSIDESSYKRPEEGPVPGRRPIAWTQAVGGGRSFYTALGHTDESWAEPLFLQHVWGGIGSVLRPPAGSPSVPVAVIR